MIRFMAYTTFLSMNVLPLGPLSPPRFGRSRSSRSYVALFSGAPLLARITVAATALVAAMENQTLQQNSGVSRKYAESLLTLEWRISDFVADLPSALPSPPSSRRRLGRRSLTSCLLPRCLVPFLPSSLARWVFSFNVVRSFFLDSSLK